MLKQIIKNLAIEQKTLKLARKTGPYEVVRIPKWLYVDVNKMPEKVRESWKAAGKVRDNKITITAALNLYHEVRGSDYRHAYDMSRCWIYDKELERLRSLIKENVDTPRISS